MNGMKIAIMGGTFNPIHIGHINAALIAKKELDLDKVLFIPSGNPPHKDVSERVENKKNRFNMTKLAIEDIEDFEISDIEIEKREKCFTIDTLKKLNKLYSFENITLILGTDMFLSFEKWKDYDKILEMCDLTVIARFFDDTDKIKHKKMSFDEETQKKIKILDSKVIQISSTEIREMILKGQNTDKFLLPKVAQYIKLNKLYIEQ